MPINKVSQTKIIFGTGDIQVGGGFKRKDNNMTGLLSFNRQEPQEIGTETHHTVLA